MKSPRPLVTLILAIVFFGCNKPFAPSGNSINPVIGDISFIEKFGMQPNSSTDEDERIRTHLEYVENLLRNRDVSLMPEDLKNSRARMLNLLHDYWTAGIFPRNYDFPDKRVPCFIDRNARICAVGYLIEHTAGRQVAEDINSKFKYENLLAMNDQRIDDWIRTSGLTKEECAMIQPSYSGSSYVSAEYGISSALMSGLNISMITVNSIQIAKGAKTRNVAIIGLLSGAGQVALGAFNYPTDDGTWWQEAVPDQRNLSLINIGMGTSTLILSTWNLIANRKPKERSFSWNVYGFPTESRNVGVGFSLVKRL